MSVDYIQVLQSVSGSRKTQYLISILRDRLSIFSIFFHVNRFFPHEKTEYTSFASSFKFPECS